MAFPRWLPLVTLALLSTLLAGCGGSSNNSGSPAGVTYAPTTTTTTATTAATTTNSNVRDAAGCLPVTEPSLDARSAKKPTTLLDPSKTYEVTIATNCGSFTFKLDQKQSPNNAASFVSLVQHGFFDKTVFERIAVGFVIQGGDPTASESGGPGYTVVDTPPTDALYTHGVVAMAKTTVAPRGAGGSQFFVVTAANAGLTGGDYAIIGEVVKGLAVVDRIGKLGDADQQPTETVEIERATVSIS
jgi:cyclophilin family peptidyl-prolyl cis-trans isomerase